MKNVKLAFFNFFGFVSIGCILSQLIPMLNQDYSSFEKSMILGGGALGSFLLSLLLGKLSDSTKKMKPSFYISMILYLSAIVLVFMIENKIIKLISFIFMIAASRVLMSSTETIVLVEKQEDFAKYHCMGAIGLICGSLLSSILHPLSKVLLCLLSGFISIVLIYKIKEKQLEGKKIEIKDMIVLLKNRQYIFTISVFFFLMLMGFADQFVVVDKMVDLGATESLISMKYALQASMEIPVYLCIKKIFEKINSLYILLFCIVMSAIKFILYGVAQNPLLVVFVSLLQIVTHPLIVVCSKRMIQKCTPEDLMASSQIIGFAIYFGISGFVTSTLGSFLSENFSYDIALYVFASFAVFPFIIWFLLRKYDNI